MKPFTGYLLMVCLVEFTLLTCAGILAASEPEKSKPNTGPLLFTSTRTDHMVLSIPPPPTSISFHTEKGQIVISLIDGSVKLPEGMKVDEASRQFWLTLAAALPYVRHQLLYGEEKKP